jgi:hypothetical protein
LSAIQQSDFNDKYSRLTKLFLGTNAITWIEDGCFRGTIITDLFLVENKLTRFPDLYEIKDTLVKLSLNDNSIGSILEADVQHLVKLTVLCLKKNPLHTITEHLVDLPSITLFAHDGDDLACCCNVSWIKNFAAAKMVGTVCSYATSLADLTWENVTESQLVGEACPTSNGPRLCREYSSNLFECPEAVGSHLNY